jgi:hypothetical protein
MKYLQFLLFVPLILLFNACSTNTTNSGGGGYYDENSTSGMQSGPVSPASPSMRPGMTPADPRDPQYLTRPQQPPPAPTANP